MRVLLAVVALAALAVGVCRGAVEAPARSTAAPAVPAPSVFVSPGGDDLTCVRGTASRPCASFGRAYALAQCGDVIEVAAGDYGDQAIIETDVGSTCTSRPVTFQPAADAVVSVGVIQGGETNVDATRAPDNLVFRKFRVKGIFAWGDAVNWVLDQIDGGSFLVAGGASNWVVQNSNWGPCPTRPADTCYTWYTPPNTDVSAGQVWVRPGASNILIENNVIHDYLIAQEGDHFECMYVDGGTNITIRRNKIYNCQTNAIAISGGSAQDGVPPDVHGTILIENNWFGAGTSINGVIKFGDLPFPSDARVVIRYNSFAEGFYSVYNEEAGQPTPGTMFIVGNILGNALNAACVVGASYEYNVFIDDGRGGGGCGAKKRVVKNPPYLNPDATASMNYRLSGASDSTRAENFVPAAVAFANVSGDRDGQRRSCPLLDAGADERLSRVATGKRKGKPACSRTVAKRR